MKLKQAIRLALAGLLAAGILTGCGGSKKSDDGSVY